MYSCLENGNPKGKLWDVKIKQVRRFNYVVTITTYDRMNERNRRNSEGCFTESEEETKLYFETMKGESDK